MENNSANQEDLIKAWTKMGASTGSMLGRLIGVGAVLGLELINSVNRPLRQGLLQMSENLNSTTMKNENKNGDKYNCPEKE